MATEREEGSFTDFLNLMKQNRAGLIGFCLSLLQVVMHASWLGFAAWLSATGQANDLKGNDWQMWLIAILILAGTLLTAVSLFLCLYGSIHGKPKVLALTGLCLSFFIGAFTTFALILNMAAPQ